MMYYLLPPVKVSQSQMVLRPTYPYQLTLAKAILNMDEFGDSTVTATVTKLHSLTIVLRRIMQCCIACRKRWVYSLDRNCRRLLCGERRSGGSVLQTIGAATEKLRWSMDVFARETNRSPRSAERSDRRDKSETGRMTCLRKTGPAPRTQSKVKAAILNCILAVTGSQ